MLYRTIVVDRRTGKNRPEFCCDSVSSGDTVLNAGETLVIHDESDSYSIHARVDVAAIVYPDVGLPVVFGVV